MDANIFITLAYGFTFFMLFLLCTATWLRARSTARALRVQNPS